MFERWTSITGMSTHGEGVEQGDRGVRVGGGVDDQRRMRAACLLNPVDEFALVVALAEVHGEIQRGGAPATGVLDIGERHPAINLAARALQAGSGSAHSEPRCSDAFCRSGRLFRAYSTASPLCNKPRLNILNLRAVWQPPVKLGFLPRSTESLISMHVTVNGEDEGVFPALDGGAVARRLRARCRARSRSSAISRSCRARAMTSRWSATGTGSKSSISSAVAPRTPCPRPLSPLSMMIR